MTINGTVIPVFEFTDLGFVAIFGVELDPAVFPNLSSLPAFDTSDFDVDGDTNQPPTVVDDTAATTSGTAVTIDVLANDSDSDGGTLQVLEAVGALFGSLQIVDNKIVYTPNADATGTETFTYLVTDGQGGNSVGTVTVTVTAPNNPPVATPVSVTGETDETIAGIVTASDDDGDTVTFSLGEDASNGTAVVNADGSFTYTANPGFVGSDSFTVIPNDGTEDGAAVTVSVTVEPDVVDGTSGDDEMLLGFTDVDGDMITTGDDSIVAGTGNDTIDGRLGANSIDAGGGDDIVLWSSIGLDAADSVDGGEGNDTIDGAGTSFGSAALFDLSNGIYTTGAFTETYSNFENYDNATASGNEQVIGTTDANTILMGSGNNSVSGLAGDDTIFGGAGNDTIDGGGGSDSLDGGVGSADTLSYANETSAVTVDLSTGGTGGAAAGDTIANFEIVIGSERFDNLIGAAGHVLYGGDGQDFLGSSAGQADLFGGDNDDVFAITFASDVSGRTFDGGGNRIGGLRDTLSVRSDGVLDFRDATVVNMETLAMADDPVDRGVQFTALQAEQFLFFIETPGTSLNQRTIEVFLDTATSVHLSGAGVTGYTQVGSGFIFNGDDDDETISATSVADTVLANGGADLIYGGTGNDSIDGGSENDTIDGGLGDDSLDGGEGVDTLSFASIDTPSFEVNGLFFGAIVDLSTQGQAQNTGAGTDIFSGFENLVGSEFNDSLIGDGSANTLTGLDGADVIIGGAGGDVIFGGSGFDAIEGGAGADSLFGGTGGNAIEGDIVTYFSATGPLVFDFGATISDIEAGSSAEVLEDTIGDDIEGVAGASDHSNTFLADELTDLSLILGGSQSETFQGGSGVDQLLGLAGNDVIYGNDGTDGLIGGGGDDDLFGGAASDAFFFDGLNEGNDTIHDLQLGADLIFFTGGNVTAFRVEDTDADGNGVTDALLTYQVNGADAGTITIIDIDATTVEAQASILGI